MNALMRRSRGASGARALGSVLAGSAILCLSSLDAKGAAIHRHGGDPSVAHYPGIPAAEVPVFKAWSKYLLAGPTTWATVPHPLWDFAVRSAVWQSIKTDPGPADPMINFLLWKQSIDPARFAYYHPKLAPALHRIEMARKTAALVPKVGPSTTVSGPGGGTSSSPGTTPATQPQNLGPPPVPEPSTLLLAAGMTAWAFRRSRGRQPHRAG